MQPEPNNPLPKHNAEAGSASSPLPANEPPVVNAPPLLQESQSNSLRKLFGFLLSLCLGFFLADAVVSLADDTVILLFDVHILTMIRGVVSLFALLMMVVIYGLMGLTPMIPKRGFLPLTLFGLFSELVLIPVFIYQFDWLKQVAWVLSFCQVVFGLGILYWAQGGFRPRWPLVAERHIEGRRFSWWNLSAFVFVNIFVLLPSALIYLGLCAVLAVDHFSEGFMALRWSGLTVQARKYVRDDGRTIQLFPMSHVGERDFYHALSEAFTSNSIILMEGVTDEKNLLTNNITYKRMATSLGVAEQQKEFEPKRGEMVRADVDVEEFTTSTIGFLNTVMLVHSKGMTAEVVLKVMQYSPPPHFEQILIDDLLHKRNRHLLEEIHSRLLESEKIIVPWGVAHMPEIAREIQRSGFHLDETQNYTVMRFRFAGNQTNGKRQGEKGSK